MSCHMLPPSNKGGERRACLRPLRTCVQKGQKRHYVLVNPSRAWSAEDRRELSPVIPRCSVCLGSWHQAMLAPKTLLGKVIHSQIRVLTVIPSRHGLKIHTTYILPKNVKCVFLLRGFLFHMTCCLRWRIWIVKVDGLSSIWEISRGKISLFPPSRLPPSPPPSLSPSSSFLAAVK